MKRLRLMGSLLVCVVCGFLYSVSASADELMMVRSHMDFPDTMTRLQESVLDHGYSLTRVQRIDIGLTGFGYQTDKYRVVFFAKHEEIEQLLSRYPEMMAYLPLKMVIFAEANETLVIASNPTGLAKYFPAPEVVTLLRRWENDFRSILEDVRTAE